MTDFHVGGPVPAASAAFVERSFQGKVRDAVVGGSWVLLLGPRQHGKTSAVIRLRSLLRDDGFLVAAIDMQELPPCDSYESLLEWWSSELAKELGVLEVSAPEGPGRGQLRTWVERIIPEGPPIVVLVDEASGISNDVWRNAFFGQLRAIANRQAAANPEDVLARLRFVFIGTFRPEALVSPNNSPFNVCTRVLTDDVTRDAALALWRNVSQTEADALIGQVHDLVGGQPYLIQLFYARMMNSERDARETAFRQTVAYLESGRDEHFSSLFSHIVGDASLCSIVNSLAYGSGIPNEPANYDFQYLEVLGLASIEDERLVIRNEFYRRIARASSQLRTVPGPAPAAQFLIPIPESDFAYMSDRYLAEIAYNAYRGAVVAYGERAYRLALAGFGATLEAVLIDCLVRLGSASLASAVSLSGASFASFEQPSDPASYRLVNLFKVAKGISQVSAQVSLSDVVRDWRNMIHPAVAARNYVPEEELAPEAQMASSLVCLLRRDLSKL